jgi:hypothetical protein
VTSKPFGIQLVCAVAVLSVIASPCVAQSSQPPGGGNPFSGLFKGTPADQPHKLDVSGSAFGAWDDNVVALAPGGNPGQIGIDPRGVRQGLASGFQGAIVYGFHTNGTRSQFSADAQGALQQFGSTAGEDMLFESYNVGVGLRTGLTSKTSFSINAGSSYAPYYQYAPFLKATTSEESPVGSDIGYAVASSWVRSDSASATLENRFSKRSSVSAGIGWDQRLSVNTPDLNIETRSARARFSHNLTRKLAVHVGYTFQESRYKEFPDREPVQFHNIDVGLGYGDGLTISFARHYTLSMNIGAGIVRSGDPASFTTTERSTQLVVTGAATLSRSLGRTWGTSIGYARGTSYILGFNEPLLSDSANAGIGGPIWTRLHFSAGVGASKSQQIFAAASDPLISYSASSRLTMGLFKNVGLYTQASYYRYSIPDDFKTTFGFTPDLDRRSVSAGLSAWLPLIKPPRVRRASDPAQPQQSDRDTR